MNGLSVLPQQPDNSNLLLNFGSNTKQTAFDSGDFAAVLKSLLSAGQEQEEGQPTENEDFWMFLHKGLEGLFLNHPAGKEANSGNVMGQMRQSATLKLESGLANSQQPVAMTPLIEFLAQKGLPTGTSASLVSGEIPQTELDQYKSEIIRLLQELNGKLEVIKPATPNVNYAIAAAKLYGGQLAVNPQLSANEASAAYTAQNAEHMGSKIANRPSVIGNKAAIITDQVLTVTNQTVGETPIIQSAATQVNPYLGHFTQRLNPSAGLRANYGTQEPTQALSESVGIGSMASDDLQSVQQLKDQLDQQLNNQHKEYMGSTLQGEPNKGESIKNSNPSFSLDDVALGMKEDGTLKPTAVTGNPKGTAPSLLNQILQALQKQTDILALKPYSRPQVERVEIQLQPAELGRIHLSVRLEDGQVHLFIQASEHNTSSLLQQQLGDLRQSLTNMGLSCGNFEMGLGEGQENTQEFEGRPHPEQQTKPYNEPIDEEALAIYAGEEHNGQLNLMA